MPLTTEVLVTHGKGDTFIETGTHKGEGVITALDAGFSKIYSIEVLESSIQYTKSRNRISKAVRNNRVEIIQGSSNKVLDDILPEIPEPVTFWLDAHSDEESVIYEELKVIGQHRSGTDTILIDDVNVMGTDHKWALHINLQNVINLVYNINSRYNLYYEDGKREKDILVADI